jgi:hypothetical protein
VVLRAGGAIASRGRRRIGAERSREGLCRLRASGRILFERLPQRSLECGRRRVRLERGRLLVRDRVRDLD